MKPIIEGIRVDLAALRAIRHECRPEACKDQPTCCTRYVPHVSAAKMETIVGCLPIVAGYCGNIVAEDGFKNVFEEWRDGSYRIDANADEACVFTYMLPTGEKRCSLHSAALDLQLNPAAVKPGACFLWPLIMLDGTLPELTVDRNWKAFPCNGKADDPHHLDAGLVDILTGYFGSAFVERLRKYEDG